MRAYLWPSEHLSLLIQMTQRDVIQRYKGSWLGIGWSVITPLLMLGVYTFVFQSVFQARWPGVQVEDSSGLYFALNLFSGLIFFTLFSDVVTRAPGAILSQPNLVKKVVFPLPLLSWVIVLSSVFQATLSLCVLLIAVTLYRGSPPANLHYLPGLFVLFVPLLMGVAWLSAALGVYFSDIQHIAALITAPLMFLSPVFYPVSMLPVWAQEWIYLNPLTLIIELSRSIFLEAPWPEAHLVAIYLLISVSTLIAGVAVFAKLRRGFADVL